MLKCMHVSQNGSKFIKDIDKKPILYIYNVVKPKKITVILYINYNIKNQRISVYSLGFLWNITAAFTSVEFIEATF